MTNTAYMHDMVLREPAVVDIVDNQSRVDQETSGAAIAEQQRGIEQARAIHQALRRSSAT